MSEYILSADYGGEKAFQAGLFAYISSPGQAGMDEIVDSDPSSALYEREWYSNWTVTSADGSPCRLLKISANGEEIEHKKTATQPFLMQYGLVQFQVEITDAAGEQQTLWSKYCSALNSSDSSNIEQMIQRIMEIEDPVKSLLRWPSRSSEEDAKHLGTEDEKYSMLTGFVTRDSSKERGSSSVLQDIIEVYKKNAGYFRARPEYTIRKEPVPVPYHCVKKLSKDSMLWSIRTGNMQRLPADSRYGIPIEGKHYMPRETLTEKSVKDHHIYENQVVVGFLDTVGRELRDRDWMEQQSRESEGFDILRMVLYPNAQLGTERLSEIESIRRQYQNSLRLEERRIPRVLSLPKQTKRFQEIQSYHDIYQKIYAWFRGGNSVDWGEGAIFKGRLADKLYEYYCWQELLRLFANKGYHKSKASVCTGYNGKRPRPPFANIVYLRKGETKITLYFDPWIPTSGSKNGVWYGITLVRTVWEPGKDGYSPDFLIKVEKDHSVSYAVLDAKFRDMKNLFDHWKPDSMSAMEESLQKYYINLSDQERLYRPVKMLWLLQGRVTTTNGDSLSNQSMSIEKGDPRATLDYYPAAYFDSLTWGAVPLNPQVVGEWAIHFWSAFRAAFRI